MSWSFYAVGSVEKLTEALDKQSDSLTGLSKEEFDAAKPHLVGLIQQNIGGNRAIQINASGHATKKDGVITDSTCTAEIRSIGQLLV